MLHRLWVPRRSSAACADREVKEPYPKFLARDVGKALFHF
jgi:hypothetical protein